MLNLRIFRSMYRRLICALTYWHAFTPQNARNVQVVWYDFYIPPFSVLIDGAGNIIDHQFVQKFDQAMPHKLYIASNRIFDNFYLLKFITLEACVNASFSNIDCVF
jgi:hypothetical protein